MIRRLSEGIFVAVIAAIIAKLVDKYMNISFMKSLWQNFFVELWPIWIGLLAALIYWCIRFLIDIYKIRKTYKRLIRWVEELENKINKDLEPRIGKLEKPAQLELLHMAMFPKKNENVV